MADEIKMHGLDALRATFAALPDRLGNNVARGALRAAAQVIRRDAQQRVPTLAEPDQRRRPGTVRKAIQVRRSKRDKFGVFVGVKPLKGRQIAAFKASGGRGSANNPDDPFYWIFLEFGTVHQPARPFLRPAFEQRQAEAIRAFEAYMAKRVVKEAEKLAREKGMQS